MSKNPESFTLTITLGNDATDTPEDVAAILEDIAGYMHRNGSWPTSKVRDINGNFVGTICVV